MRKKNKTQSTDSLLAAQDLQIEHMKNEIEGLRRSAVTIKKALNAPLVLWESFWFDGLEAHEQMQINKAADLIARTLRPTQSLPLVITSTTPLKPSKTATRKRSTTTNSSARWTKADDAILRKMKKAGKTTSEIATTLGRSDKAVMNRLTTLKKGK